MLILGQISSDLQMVDGGASDTLVHENGGYWYVLADKGVFWRASAGFDRHWRIWAESTQ